jgi:gamma-glutamylcyclotransferase (GGCT)/AIG2-like uncharacterized protein YtfP
MSTANRALFVYGTLRDRDVLALVLGHAPGTTLEARAPDCRVVFYPGRSYPALLRGRDGAAEGLLLTDLSEPDFAVLDAFEGDEYVRGPIEIIVNGAPGTVDVYWPIAAIAADAAGWSLADWTARHKAAFLAAETHSVAELRQRLTAIRSD